MVVTVRSYRHRDDAAIPVVTVRGLVMGWGGSTGNPVAVQLLRSSRKDCAPALLQTSGTSVQSVTSCGSQKIQHQQEDLELPVPLLWLEEQAERWLCCF